MSLKGFQESGYKCVVEYYLDRMSIHIDFAIQYRTLNHTDSMNWNINEARTLLKEFEQNVPVASSIQSLQEKLRIKLENSIKYHEYEHFIN